MGMGATNALDRVAAMVGDISEVPLDFKASESVPNAGVLFALPALLSMGLLAQHPKTFSTPQGLLWPCQHFSIAGLYGAGAN